MTGYAAACPPALTPTPQRVGTTRRTDAAQRLMASVLVLVTTTVAVYGQSSLEDYRRSQYDISEVDMAVGLFIPGYPLFEVDRPGEALFWGTLQMAGMAAMPVALVRQWSDLDALWGSDLDSVREERLLVNATVFGAGAALMVGSWMIDSLRARTVARMERTEAEYKAAMVGDKRQGAPADAAAWARYLQLLAVGTSPDASAIIIRDAAELLRIHPFDKVSGQVAVLLGTTLLNTGDAAGALPWLLRALWVHPQGIDAEATRLAALKALIRLGLDKKAEGAWLALVMKPDEAKPPQAYYALLSKLADLDAPALRQEVLAMADDYLASVEARDRHADADCLYGRVAKAAGKRTAAEAASFHCGAGR